MIQKYRIWHKAREQIFEVRRLDFVNNDCEYADEASLTTQNWVSLNNVILMQSSSLHDKNGVEIFEGDLLIHEANIFIVERINSGFIPVRKCEFGYDRLTNYLIAEAIRIGNIHQNPELLEQ